MAALLAFLHHVAAFVLVSALVVEFMLVRDELNVRNARRLQVADLVYGIAAGVLHCDSGTIEPVGVPRGAAAVGYLSQGFSLYRDLSIGENLLFFADLHEITGYEGRRDELLDLTGLAPFADRRADRLSGGMQQKLALACSLIHSPRLLLLDEPTTGVDPVSRREFWTILTRLRRHGVSALIATPYFDEAARCDTVVLLHQGRVLRSGEPGNLLDELEGVFREYVCTPTRRARDIARETEGVLGVQLFGDRIHVHFAERSADGRTLAARLSDAGVVVSHSGRVEPGLENLFMTLIEAA